VVICDVRGEVEIVGLSGGRIPWLIGKRDQRRALVLCGALADAVRREAAIAVAYWWEVTGQTVTVWRKALGVGPMTDGTSRLRSLHSLESWAAEARAKAHAKSGDPGRRAKIAAAKRGKPRPVHVIEAMRAGNTGRVHGEDERRRRSASLKRRGVRPPKAGRPWTAGGG
jgi:hypothetical protein